MKIIEALKKIKELTTKSEDYRTKLKSFCADHEFETPTYPDQRQQITEWLQGHKDLCREIGALKFRLAKTNLATMVPIQLGENTVTKSIYEWIERRRSLSAMELMGWQCLSNRGLREGQAQQSNGQLVPLKIRYYYDQREKDKAMAILSSEPGLIDAKLEIINAITDLLD